MLVRAAYKDEVTYWGAPVSDGAGGFTFAAPKVLNARWEDKAEEFSGLGGLTEVSRAIVYLPESVTPGGFLYKGTSTATDPEALNAAYKIRQIADIPSIRHASREIRAFL